MATESAIRNPQSAIEMIPRCFACADLGYEVSAESVVSTCWRVRAKAPHNEPSAAAVMLRRSLDALFRSKMTIDPHVLDVAKTLMTYATDRPCLRDELIEQHFAYSPSSLRACHAVIEILRKIWLLPVGSRKQDPAGYWVITDIKDFAEWVSRSKSAPITQLTTIHRVAKRNFPVFAEQMELEFYNDIKAAA